VSSMEPACRYATSNPVPAPSAGAVVTAVLAIMQDVRRRAKELATETMRHVGRGRVLGAPQAI
jgi:hypothetical protein